ncbi:MAG: hypothetical protein ACOYXU_15150 [Nitrospirota bacterium]
MSQNGEERLVILPRIFRENGESRLVEYHAWRSPGFSDAQWLIGFAARGSSPDD